MIVLGIDIGGSSTKGALVDTVSGELVSDRLRHKSSKAKKPKDIVKDILKIAKELDYEGIIGAGFPGPVKNGMIGTAVNMHKDWVNANLGQMLKAETGYPAYVLNDADAAGMGEMRFGSPEARAAQVAMFLTLGTGLGTALFVDGHLMQNTELGHMLIGEKSAEEYSTASVIRRENLTWKQWALRFDKSLHIYEFLLSPDLFILGGGISARFDKYERYFTVKTKVIPAKLQNLAGIVGAAVAAKEKLT
jgi:polyphosphate glucokinase